MNSWIATLYPSAPWKLICSTCHCIHFLFRLPRTWLFMSNSAGVSRKAEAAYPNDAPSPCSQFSVRFAHLLLLLCMYYFSYLMFFVVYVCFPCLVLVPGLHSFDYPRTLVPWLLFRWFKIASILCISYLLIFLLLSTLNVVYRRESKDWRTGLTPPPIIFFALLCTAFKSINTPWTQILNPPLFYAIQVKTVSGPCSWMFW